ncbi:MAG: hypothetical protein RIB78_05110 [Gammaproteobacteria bacterium]
MQVIAGIGRTSTFYRVAAVLWLSFLMAGIATGAFFSLIDPLELKYCVDFPEVSRTAAYSIGFLLFWLLTASSSLLSVFFLYPTRDTESQFHNSDSSL